MVARFGFASRLLFLASGVLGTFAQNLTQAQVEAVVERLAEGANASWELGTRTQTLIELNTPPFSVLTNGSSQPPSRHAPDSLSEVNGIAARVVQNRPQSNGNAKGPQALIRDGSSADPASMGVAVLVAGWTRHTNGILDFNGAAKDQLDFLMNNVPKTQDGALSHRNEQVQLWSDFVYMVPPFLAYYGLTSTRRDLLVEAYNQCRLYRQYLRDDRRDSPTRNLWRHVVLGNWQDTGFWSTGNGWAAAGMLRVLGTIQNSRFASSLRDEIRDLGDWVNEIHDGIYPFLRSNGLFNNYADNAQSFADASSTALLAATVYRNAILTGTDRHIADADRSRLALFQGAPPSSSGGGRGSNSESGSGSGSGTNATASFNNMPHFTYSGWVQPVVNPYSFGEEGQHSPEGQAFVLQLHAAWRDWVQEQSSKNSTSPKGTVNAVATGVIVESIAEAMNDDGSP